MARRPAAARKPDAVSVAEHEAKVAAALQTVPENVWSHILKISTDVGKLASGVEFLIHQQAEAKRQNEVERAEASESRRALYREVNTLSHKVEVQAATLGRIVPMVEAHDDNRLKKIGALALLRSQWKGVSALAAAMTWSAAKFSTLGDLLPSWLARILLLRSGSGV